MNNKKVLSVESKENVCVKPFLKWAGGKGQLLNEIEQYYPFKDSNITKYAEPFVGGGAVLFDILSKYNLKEVYISDINAELINTYRIIKDKINDIIDLLSIYQSEYLPLNTDKRRDYYNIKRERFNDLKINGNEKENMEKAALMIFLNKTCFNGLYRVNRKGLFNVPMGSYKNPLICDEKNLRAVSEKLQKVTIVCADYKNSFDFIDEHTFVYIDPPYRPITDTARFTAYTEILFNDEEQIELSKFVDKINEKGAKIVISNSDPKNSNTNDDFFEKIYSAHNIRRVEATRMINCNGESRGKIKELLISNFIKPENTIMFIEKSTEELIDIFENNLLDTNRGYNYYIDWSNIKGYEKYSVEIHAMDVLIGKKDEDFFNAFKDLLVKLPTVIEVFPYLFALAKSETNKVRKNSLLKVVGSNLDSDDFQSYSFNANKLPKPLSDETILKYYNFFEQMGLKHLFQILIEKSTLDYIIGVLVGSDSNGRKNRGGTAFELACQPIIETVCQKYGIELFIQKKFAILKQYEFDISEDIVNRKADFILLNPINKKCMNIEVNFFNGAGSKPEEIIDSYINRQSDLRANGISFALITDGNCWRGTTNQLSKGFRHLKYLMNFRLAKAGMLEEIIIKELSVNYNE